MIIKNLETPDDRRQTISNIFIWFSTVSECVSYTSFSTYGVRPPPALAQTIPGDACTTTNWYQTAGGPQSDGKMFIMTCQDGAWLRIIETDTAGNVGVKQELPKTPLDVGGEIKVGASTGLACDSNREGAIRYSATENCIELCDGTKWGCMGTPACSDATPDALVFTDIINQNTGAVVSSNIDQITGISCPTAIGISGTGTPQFRICSDSACANVVQDWTNSQAFIDNNEYLQLRLTTNGAGGNTHNATIAVGNTVDYWDATTTFPDCTGSPAVGTVCADGTVYAGISLDGNVKMYTTRCDAGMSWSGSACTGTRTVLPWNNGTTNYQGTGATSTTQGEANTTTLVGLTSNTDYPYYAAAYCADLTENGHTDWYLPSDSELVTIVTEYAAIGNLLPGNWYWTATERSLHNISVIRPIDRYQGSYYKTNTTVHTRCVRR